MTVQNCPEQLSPVAKHMITHLIQNQPVESNLMHKIGKTAASVGALTVIGVGALPYISPNIRLVDGWALSEDNEIIAKTALIAGNVTCFTFLSIYALWQLLGHSFHPTSSYEREITNLDNNKTLLQQRNTKIAALGVAAITRIPDVAVAVVFSDGVAEKAFLAACSATTVSIPWLSTYYTLNKSYKKLCSSERIQKINALRAAFLSSIGLKRQQVINEGTQSETLNQLLAYRNTKHWNPAEIEAFLEFITKASSGELPSAELSKLEKYLNNTKTTVDISLGSMFALSILAINFALTFDLCKELGTDDIVAGLSSGFVSATLVYFLFSAFIGAVQSHTNTISSACRGRFIQDPAAKAYPATTTALKVASLLPVAFCWGPITEFCKTYFNQDSVLENLMIASTAPGLVLLFANLLPHLTETALQTGIKKFGNNNSKNYMKGIHLLDDVSAFISSLPENAFADFAHHYFTDKMLNQYKTTREELQKLQATAPTTDNDESIPLKVRLENV